LLIAGLLLLLSPRLYRRVSLATRFAFLVALVFLLMMFLFNSFLIPDMFAWLGRAKKSRSRLSLLFPPLWFAGLYEWLLGNRDPAFGLGAAIAIVSLLVPSRRRRAKICTIEQTWTDIGPTFRTDNYG